MRDLPFSSAHPSLRRALTARGYVAPTPVQAAIMAPDVDVRDVLVSAQTGSGKTVAFGLALAKTLLGDDERFGASGAPRALIVTPTRELAMQVHRELSWLYAETGARITTCVGGMDPRRESYALSHGVHIVVGTPGRLCDHLARGSLVLERIAAVVLDEADEMLDMGFREDLERLLDAAPKERRTLMFSATIPKPIATLAKRYQRDAMRVATSAEGERHHDIQYQVVSIVPRERDLAVVNLLRFHNPAGALVFCGTRDGVTHLASNLSERGFSVAALSGELSQRERNQALQALRDGRARVCVATDVAARGLDLPNLDLVIHADLPQNKEALVHRSGRTGRAGKKGLAIIIAAEAANRFVERLLYSARIDAAWLLPPSSDDIRARDQEHLVAEITALTETISDPDRAVAATLLTAHSAEDLVAALVGLRREARPAPEELSVPMSMRQRNNADRRAQGREGDRPRYDHAVRLPARGPDDRPTRFQRPDARGPDDRPSRYEAPQRNDRAPHAERAPFHDRPQGGRPQGDRPQRIITSPRPATPPRADLAPAPRAEPAVVAPRRERAEAAAVTPRVEAADVAPRVDRVKVPELAELLDIPTRTPDAVERTPAAADVELTPAAAGVELTPAPAAAKPARAPAAAKPTPRAADDESAGAAPSEPATSKSAARAERPGRADRRERVVPADRAEYAQHARPERPSRTDQQTHDEAKKLVWFTINIGRSKNADPKWLIPLLCRRGGISKNAIGKIQILARETRVEISTDVSERFAAAVREPDAKDRNIHIEPLDAVAV